jgi:hypothetical protein
MLSVAVQEFNSILIRWKEEKDKDKDKDKDTRYSAAVLILSSWKAISCAQTVSQLHVQ